MNVCFKRNRKYNPDQSSFKTKASVIPRSRQELVPYMQESKCDAGEGIRKKILSQLSSLRRRDSTIQTRPEEQTTSTETTSAESGPKFEPQSSEEGYEVIPTLLDPRCDERRISIKCCPDAIFRCPYCGTATTYVNVEPTSLNGFKAC